MVGHCGGTVEARPGHGRVSEKQVSGVFVVISASVFALVCALAPSVHMAGASLVCYMCQLCVSALPSRDEFWKSL